MKEAELIRINRAILDCSDEKCVNDIVKLLVGITDIGEKVRLSTIIAR